MESDRSNNRYCGAYVPAPYVKGAVVPNQAMVLLRNIIAMGREVRMVPFENELKSDEDTMCTAAKPKLSGYS